MTAATAATATTANSGIGSSSSLEPGLGEVGARAASDRSERVCAADPAGKRECSAKPRTPPDDGPGAVRR